VSRGRKGSPQTDTGTKTEDRKPEACQCVNSGPFKTACLLIIPLFLLIIAALYLLDIKTVFEPPLLLAVMNTLFLGIIPVYIAVVAYRMYRINGSFVVLFLGSGMLVFGLGAIAAGWLNGLPNGSNITTTIHNVSVFIGSAFSLASVLLAVVGEVPQTRKAVQSVTIMVYGGAVVFEVLLIFSAVLGLLPPFFVPGTGPSVLRQVILSNAAEMYALAAILFFFLYGKKRDHFFFWFSLSLGLVATGLLAVLVQPAVGSMVGWAGRSAQYLGACFALVAIQAAKESATRSGISLPAQFNTFFGRGAATSAILAAAQESIWLFGTDDTILMANPTALARLGGRSDREVIGHRYQEFMPKELATSRRARLEEVMRKKEPVRFEDERNGILFDHSFYPVFDEDGTVTGIAAFSRDITDVRRAEDALSGINEELTATQEELQKNLDELMRNEQKLRESEERYRTVADFMLDWEFWFGPDGTFIFLSPSADQVLGRPVGTFSSVELFLHEVVHPEDLSLRLAHLKDELSGKGPSELEYRIVRPDGEVRWIHHICRPIRDPSGRFLGTRGSNRDITERRQAEEALKRAHDQLETRVEERTAALQQAIAALSTERHRLYEVLEGLPAYICLLNEDYRMPFANRTFRELFAEPGGRRCYEFLFNRTEPCETCESYTVMKTRAPHHRYWIGPNGRDYDIYDFPFTDTDGSSMILEMGIDITERNKAEEERSNLASIVQNSDDAIIGKSLDGTIMSWNTGAERMYGYSAEEATGRNISMLLPPGREDDLADILNRIRNRTPVHHYETVRVRNDGSKIQVSLTISPILDRDGALIGASTIARDITGQKNAEMALRKANLYNRSLIEASLDPLVTISPDGTISDVNEATIRATGYTRGELVGTDFSDYFTDPAKAKAGYEAAFRDGSVTDYPLGIRHRNGQVTPVLYNAAVYRDAEGKITGVFAAARDITGQKKAEMALRKANLYNRSLIEASLDPLVTISPDGTISDVNEATIRATGYTRGELVGTDFSDYFTDPAKAKAGYETAFRDGSVTDYPLGIRHRNGQVTPVLYNAAVYRDAEGKITGVFAAARDITGQKKAEEALQKAHDLLEVRVEERTAELAETNTLLQNEIEVRRNAEEALRKNEVELREALSEKEVLLAEIHHRVKNNLTAFISLLSLEGSYEESPAGLVLKKDLQNRARSMALIHETLYRTGKYSSVRMSMYLSTLVGQIAGSFDPEQTVRIVVSGDGVSIDLARATPCGLIVNELVTNSFKYAFPASFDCRKIRGASCTVTVNIAEEGDCYVMNVQDNGIGLPAEFDVRHARSLGLKLVNFLAKHQLRATVEVRSEEGTAFELRFPVNQQHTRDS